VAELKWMLLSGTVKVRELIRGRVIQILHGCILAWSC
jgi:hypothetical protein